MPTTHDLKFGNELKTILFLKTQKDERRYVSSSVGIRVLEVRLWGHMGRHQASKVVSKFQQR
jgi:hypothetical protein